jgi:hypothetical protein
MTTSRKNETGFAINREAPAALPAVLRRSRSGLTAGSFKLKVLTRRCANFASRRIVSIFLDRGKWGDSSVVARGDNPVGLVAHIRHHATRRGAAWTLTDEDPWAALRQANPPAFDEFTAVRASDGREPGSVAMVRGSKH